MLTKLTTPQAGELKGIQASILGKYGIEAINEAWGRLCTQCHNQQDSSLWKNHVCRMIPIGLDGKDCPYYQKKESE